MEQKLYPSMTSSAPYDLESKAKVSSFNNFIQNISLMMKYYEVEEKTYKKNTPNTS